MAQTRHIPTRMCRVCRRKLPQSELSRWTVQAGTLVADDATPAPGRGYYSCSPRCAEIIPRTISSKTITKRTNKE